MSINDLRRGFPITEKILFGWGLRVVIGLVAKQSHIFELREAHDR